MEERYRKECPDCGEWFWVEISQIETSWIDGSVKGFRCPCEALVAEGVGNEAYPASLLGMLAVLAVILLGVALASRLAGQSPY